MLARGRWAQRAGFGKRPALLLVDCQYYMAGIRGAPDNAAKWHGAVDQGRAQGDEAQVVGTAGLGAVGGYAALADFTTLGGQLTVFGLPN